LKNLIGSVRFQNSTNGSNGSANPMPIDAARGARLAACLPFFSGTARGPRLPFSFSGGRRRAPPGPSGAIRRLAVGGKGLSVVRRREELPHGEEDLTRGGIRGAVSRESPK